MEAASIITASIGQIISTFIQSTISNTSHTHTLVVDNAAKTQLASIKHTR
jgi:hypothetical protein